MVSNKKIAVVLTLDKDETSRLFNTSKLLAWSYACLCSNDLSASLIRLEASETRMPWGSCHGSGVAAGVTASALFVSERVRLRCRLLFRLDGRPRSITEDSDMFLLCAVFCDAIGSRLSTLGDPRLDAGDAALNGFVNAEGGVGRAMVCGDRRASTALSGVFPPDVREAGVISCVLLALELNIKGAGEPLRSVFGDLGGTLGGSSKSMEKPAVSTFNSGFGLDIGLMMGDSGFPEAFGVSADMKKFICWDWFAEGPVTQETMASPNGPAFQLVPGTLHDLS
jgi:hypothetical protein